MYQDIVASVRSRIASGELRPGDRIPSARQITREWGVAIATATRALAALRDEGLVRPVVGVGTIVAERPQETVVQPPRRPGVEHELTRDRIVRTAVAIADAEGLPAMTMRRLATELDVAVMSLYRHVAGKDELVLLMTDHIFGEEPLPDPPFEDWRTQIEAVCRLQWRSNKKHPWMASIMSISRPMMAPNGMAQTDSNMATLKRAGLNAVDALQATVALAGLLLGIGASFQLEADAERDTGLTQDEWMDKQEAEFGLLSDDRFPMLAEVAAVPDFDMSLDDVFETGLRLMLDGLAQRIGR